MSARPSGSANAGNEATNRHPTIVAASPAPILLDLPFVWLMGVKIGRTCQCGNPGLTIVVKIDVPSAARVIGFDDVRHATLLSVAVTTTHQRCRDIAGVAFRALHERIREPTIPPSSLSDFTKSDGFVWRPGWSSANPAAPTG